MTVSAYITSHEEPQRQIMTILRSWVLDLGQHVEEKIIRHVPYFFFYGQLCSLTVVKDGVDFSFVRGNEIEDQEKLLESRGRKKVKSITFYSVAETEEYEDEMRRLLNRAAILNEYWSRKKLTKNRRNE